MKGNGGRVAFQAVIVAAATLFTVGVVRSFEPTAAMKNGPATIDVSKYPPEQQKDYELFSQKCQKCHKQLALRVPINATFVTPGEWQRIVKRMLHKVDSKMTEDEAKTIYKFLVYDASVRKADSLRAHLGLLSDADRKEAIEKVQAINPKFEYK